MNVHARISAALNQREARVVRVEAIKAIYEPGMSAEAIATAVGRHLGEYLSRNAVIGLYHRNKDALKEYPLQRVGGSSSKPATAKQRTFVYVPKPRPVKINPAIVEDQEPVVKPTEYDATALLIPMASDQYDGKCKWPVAERNGIHLFCGHDRGVDPSYCSHHRMRNARKQA